MLRARVLSSPVYVAPEVRRVVLDHWEGTVTGVLDAHPATKMTDGSFTAAGVIRVASVPADHVYVRHLSPVDAVDDLPLIVRLDDPDPDDPRQSATSRWWPPAMLDPQWVRDRSDFDVFHLQFGFDARAPEELQELVAALRETNRPLVYTVHDLRNPHHASRDEHDAQLDVLIPAADTLVTLTDGAAAEIESRWGRRPLVLPHPHVADFGAMRRAMHNSVRRSVSEFRVGVHVKSLRASMNPLAVLRVLTEVVSELPGGVLQVNGHSDVLLPDGERYDAELAGFLHDAEADGAVELRVHDFLDDEALWAYLESLDVSVLPYRFGTHSGWLEACRDLGTAVVAPDCGYYRDQGPVFEYGNNESGLDADSLADAVQHAYAAPRAVPLPIAYRRDQRQQVAEAHARLYAGLIS